MIITIDGPSASGKSTVASRIAQKIHLFYIYSGLLFRGLAYCLQVHYNYTKDTIAQATQQDIDACVDPDRFVYEYTDDAGARILFDQHDITSHLKTELADQQASLIGTNAHARTQLAQLQRTIAHAALQKKGIRGVIVDGRDSGSGIFVDAQYKFYLTASPEVRAKRMCATHAQSDDSLCEHALQAIKMRDERDAQRDIAPLKVPDGAIVIDTSNVTVNEVVTAICSELF